MKKIIPFLTLLILPVLVSAKTYEVELITSESEINNSTKDDYIFVVHGESGSHYAWVNEGLEGENTNQTQSTNNATEVKFNADFTELTTVEEKDILWTFGLSVNSINKSVDSVVLVARNNLFGDKNQIVFSDTTNSNKSPTGFNYRNNAYPMIFEFDSNGNVIMTQADSSSNDKIHWITFSENQKRLYITNKIDNATKEMKIYRVVEKYKKVEGYESPSQEIAFNKNKLEDSTFNDTGIYQIDLTLEAGALKKDTDVLLILDISNSMDNNNKIDKLKSSANYFVEEILKINSNNRIGIVKFADGNAYEEESLSLGLSSDVAKIEELIAKEATSKLGGTNYTDAFLLAHEILETNAVSGRDQLVIFVTDGAPTIYNKTKFSVFKNTEDGGVGAYATNWTNYFLNNELGPVEKMKEAGVSFITIGVDVNKDMAIKTDGSFVVKGESAQELLKKIASTEDDFYQVNDYNNLETTFTLIKKQLESKLLSDTITDNIEEGYKLLISPIESKIPYIEIKNESGKVIERITFNNDGTKAYSSINPEVNILKEASSGMVLGATTFNYDFSTKTLKWNAENITDDKVIFTYFIVPEENPVTKDYIIPIVILFILSIITIKINYNKIKYSL